MNNIIYIAHNGSIEEVEYELSNGKYMLGSNEMGLRSTTEQKMNIRHSKGFNAYVISLDEDSAISIYNAYIDYFIEVLKSDLNSIRGFKI